MQANFPSEGERGGLLLQLSRTGLRWCCTLLPSWLAHAIVNVALMIFEALIPNAPPPPSTVDADLGRSPQSDEA
jgi:hypothetical protein